MQCQAYNFEERALEDTRSRLHIIFAEFVVSTCLIFLCSNLLSECDIVATMNPTRK